MYKLVACDVDGTILVPGQNKIDAKMFARINNLCNMGIEVVIASGRPYYELAELFSPVASLLTFICCDGGVIVRNGRIFFEMPLLINEIFPFLNSVSDMKSMFYGVSSVFTQIDMIKGHIYKICFEGLSELQKEKLRQITPPNLYIRYDDNGLMEFLPVGSDKGIALTFLQKKLRILPAECIAFGDNCNDIWMLRSVGLPFVMKNARFDLSDITTNSVEDVGKTLDELFFNKRSCL